MVRSAVLLVVTLAAAHPVVAQQPAAPHVIRWYEAGGATAGVLLLMLAADEPVQRFAQRNRTPTSNDIAAIARHTGQPEVYLTTTLGLIAVGLAAKNPQIAKAGGRAAASIALAAAIELPLKLIIGRARPDSGLGTHHFDSFSIRSRSMPSGHSALSFALVTSLAGEVRSTWARVGLYTLGAATALSRVHDDRHWVSDITAGTLIGITSAKLVGGDWRVFGLKPPRFLVSEAGTQAVGWSFAF